MTTRRGFLGSLLALAAAPAIAGFVPTPVSVAIDPVRYINVLAYGADPIGRTDSTRAFQQAIDAAAGSGTVHFPAREHTAYATATTFDYSESQASHRA
jgi:hypothetical protein